MACPICRSAWPPLSLSTQSTTAPRQSPIVATTAKRSISATALARLIPIYVLEDPRKARQAVSLDLTSDSFTRGATRLRRRDGTSVSELSVLQTDLRSALAQFRKAGLPLFLAGAAGRGELASAPLCECYNIVKRESDRLMVA